MVIRFRISGYILSGIIWGNYICTKGDMDQIKTICVCGAGTMGSGIAQLAAMTGISTIQFDISEEMLEKSRKSLENNLNKLVNKDRITPVEKEEIISRIRFSSQINDCVADLVIEAIIEKKEAKQNLFNQLALINHPQTILASNTSSISITEIAKSVASPFRVIGMHFFNPAPVMKLVEIVRTEDTDEEIIRKLVTLSEKMGKIPVVCNDSPGFIVNRVARPYYLEAMRLVEAGLATIETVDIILESAGFKMGPFRLMDLIGMDINFGVSHIVWQALGEPDRLRPSLLQEQKVKQNELGRKTGKGFYTYP